MQICGFNKTTLLDYPGHVAATIFTGCCNFRCPFCQNGDLVLSYLGYVALLTQFIPFIVHFIGTRGKDI